MVVLGMLLAAAAVESASTPPTFEARFAPLRKSEKAYVGLGPVGPFYPAAAASQGRNGEAVIECRVGAAGELKRCKVASEEPRKNDFGAAAQRMASSKRLFADGEPGSGDLVRVRVPFTIGAAVQVAP